MPEVGEVTYTIAVATEALREFGINTQMLGIEDDVEVVVFPAKDNETYPTCYELLEVGMSLLVPKDYAAEVCRHVN